MIFDMQINRSDIMKQRLGKVLFFFVNVLIPLAYGLLFYMLRRPGSIVTGIFTTFIPSFPLADIRSSFIFPLLKNHEWLHKSGNLVAPTATKKGI